MLTVFSTKHEVLMHQREKDDQGKQNKRMNSDPKSWRFLSRLSGVLGRTVCRMRMTLNVRKARYKSN